MDTVLKVPKGWSVVSGDWPWKRRPMYKRVGYVGLLWIYRQDDLWSLEAQGHVGALVTGTDIDDVVEYADEFDCPENLRVADMDAEEWTDDFYGRSLIAFHALSDGDNQSIETAREQIGRMEALLHELRGRLRDKEATETFASRAERKSVELKLCVHDFYTCGLLGHVDSAATALDMIDEYTREMRKELVALRREAKRRAS